MFNFNLDERNFSVDLTENQIEAIRIFGSYVRGEYDSKSDIDFFIIIENCSPDSLKKRKSNIAKQLDIPADWITLFTKSDVIYRAKKGQYFFWSVKLEGQTIYSKSGFMEEQFDYLKICSLYEVKRMLNYNANIYSSTVLGYPSNKKELEKKLYFIAKLVRDICVDIDYLHGVIEFRNLACVDEYLKRDPHPPFTLNEYKTLLSFKRDMNANHLSGIDFEGDLMKYVNLWAKKLDTLLLIAQKEIYYYEQKGFSSPLSKD